MNDFIADYNDFISDYSAKMREKFFFMNLMATFNNHDQVYLENIERHEYSSLSDAGKRHIVKKLKNGADLWNLDPIGMAMMLDFIKRYDYDDNEEDIEL